jgi:hypothetical protein
MATKRDLSEADARIKRVDEYYCCADYEYQKARNNYVAIRIEENNDVPSEKQQLALRAWIDAHIKLEEANKERIRAEKALVALINGNSYA